MEAAPKFFVIIGGATTVMLAEAAAPAVLASLTVIVLVVLFFTPGVRPVTVVDRVHVPPAAILMLLMSISVDGPMEKNPPQPVPIIEPTVRPAGRKSVNAPPVRARSEFGFVMVKVRLVDCPSGIVAAPNDFDIVGGEPAHGLEMVVPYTAVLPKSFVVPGRSFPKLKTQELPVPD